MSADEHIFVPNGGYSCLLIIHPKFSLRYQSKRVSCLNMPQLKLENILVFYFENLFRRDIKHFQLKLQVRLEKHNSLLNGFNLKSKKLLLGS